VDNLLYYLGGRGKRERETEREREWWGGIEETFA
jgi:hypothetical protein